MQYRREIDGLRAVAVVPVMLFHAGYKTFGGGYIGVDVFFVISGYLITKTLLEDIERREFSLVSFYERRARRILPALFFIIFMIVPFAWFLLLPEQMVLFGRSVVYTALFASNFFFYHQQGYFSENSELQPLLHTWSLAVEEQFYLIFPVVLAIAMRFGKRNALCVICILAIASFAHSQHNVSTSPETRAAFYLAPSRAWELFAGSICAFIEGKQWGRGNGLLGLIGIGVIIGSIAYFNESMPFPGIYAALPVVGACFVLLFADGKTSAARLLSFPPLVGIGLISYSAYLWHQPLLAFARIHTVTKPGQPLIVAVLALTFCLAFLSWRYVEKPFRKRGGAFSVSRRVVFRSAGIGAAVLIVLGIVGQQDGGLEFRYSPQEQALLKSSDFRYSMVPSGLRKCFIDYDQKVDVLFSNNCVPNSGGRRVIVFGDSEAAHLMTGVKTIFTSRGYEVGEWAATGCRPFSYAQNSQRCINFIKSFWGNASKILQSDDIIIVGANWSSSLDDLGEQDFLTAIRDAFENLSHAKAKVLIVGDVPNFPFNPPRYIVQTGQAANEEVIVEPQPDSVGSKSNFLVKAEAQRLHFGFVDPSPSLCQFGSSITCAIKIAKGVVYFDENHLSSLGSEIVGEYFKPYAQ